MALHNTIAELPFCTCFLLARRHSSTDYVTRSQAHCVLIEKLCSLSKGHACRSTIEHPSCESALEIAKQCCRDEAGQPWPPVPPHNTMTSFLTGAPSYQVHALSHADVPSLEDINVNKGHMFRPGHHAPFPNTWKASAVICARWDRSTDESALHEWLDHHRCGALYCIILRVM